MGEVRSRGDCALGVVLCFNNSILFHMFFFPQADLPGLVHMVVESFQSHKKVIPSVQIFFLPLVSIIFTNISLAKESHEANLDSRVENSITS